MRRRVVPLLLTLAAAPLAAQADPPPRDTVPVVLTISGGISLGSYESGVNWALIDFFRHSYHDPAFRGRYGVKPHRLDVAAGASAGNINALLSSLEWCAGYARRPPERSLLWQLWTGTGIAELFPNDRAQRRVPDHTAGGSYGIFRRDSLESFYNREVLQRMRSPGNADCAVSLGITLTKLQVDSIELTRASTPARSGSCRCSRWCRAPTRRGRGGWRSSRPTRRCGTIRGWGGWCFPPRSATGPCATPRRSSGSSRPRAPFPSRSSR